MVLSPGDHVDRYVIADLLGSGGMGEVYRAYDPKLARMVALKILRVDRGLGTDGAARLLREARAAAALSHPNVLAVFDVGDVSEPEALRGLSYIAMELVTGQSLRAYVGDASVPMDKRVAWLRDVASALRAAHQANVVHRDVKPENVMVSVEGTVKVLDFGIARRAVTPLDDLSTTGAHSLSTVAPAAPPLPTLTGQGTIVGTPFYMAPEQLRAEVIDARADQFAWGVVAYALLTGKPPWPGGDQPLAVVSQILSYDPPAPVEVDPRVAPAVSQVVVRALAKRRDDRFPSMAELLAALDGPRVPTAVAAPQREAPRHTGEGNEAGARTGSARTGADAPRRSGLAWVGAAVALAVTVGAAARWGTGRAKTGESARMAASSPAPTGECTTNAECVHAHGGEAWHCHTERHTCLKVASPDCKVYAEPHDAEADDVVWLGGMYPLTKFPTDSEARAADLARQDFARELGFGAGRAGALHARPIGLVLCDEEPDAKRAAHHLVDDVEVPAVLGFFSAPKTLDTMGTVFLPAHVLSVVTMSQSPAVLRIPEPPGEPRLVWRTTLNRDDATVPLAHFVSDVLEPAMRTGPRAALADMERGSRSGRTNRVHRRS